MSQVRGQVTTLLNLFHYLIGDALMKQEVCATGCFPALAVLLDSHFIANGQLEWLQQPARQKIV